MSERKRGSMRPPNHLAALYLPEQTVQAEWRPTVLRLMKAEKDAADPAGLVFVDDSYGKKHWAERAAAAPDEAPPTWIDPELFVRLVLLDPYIEQLSKGLSQDTEKATQKKLRELILKTLREQYIPYLESCMEEASSLLAEWLQAHCETVCDDQKEDREWERLQKRVGRKPAEQPPIKRKRRKRK